MKIPFGKPIINKKELSSVSKVLSSGILVHGNEATNFENNFNCDVRYYPATMDKKWMDYTMEKIDSLKVWSDEQDIYNDMLWGQGVTVDEVHEPKMAYQGHMIPNLQQNIEVGNDWNGIHINDAHIVHWHSSRGIANRVQLFNSICEWLEVPIQDD